FQEKISTIFQVAPSRALLDFSRFFLDFLRQQARSDSRALDRAKAPFWSVPKALLTNYNGNHTYGDGKKGVYREKTTPVGSFPANAWGLHDMHGNLFQWCEDWYGDYPQKDVVGPQGPDKGDYRVLRGGSWRDLPPVCRSASRVRDVPSDRSDNIGFRLCFFVEQSEETPKPPVIDKPQARQKEPPKTLTNGIGMKFVWIPPGNFVIGSPKDEKERGASETQHKVTLTKGFY